MSIAKPRRIGGIIGSVPRTTSGVYGLTKLSEVNFPFAIGGDTYTYAQDGKYWRCHMFSQVGSDTLTFLRGGLVEYLVVGGGGGGGGGQYGYAGGGGGAGGLRHGSGFGVKAGVYSISVGDGGAAGTGSSTSAATDGTNGGNSSFGAITAAGGGGGGRGNAAGGIPGLAGGSGGGGGTANTAGTTAGGAGNTPATTPSQGNAGGIGYNRSGDSANINAGGGGGAGAAGGDSTADLTASGGDGVQHGISGAVLYYAGGGAAAGVDGPATGGLGGGGDGVTGTQLSTPGEDFVGGGGGGGQNGPPGFPSLIASAGGSGIVIVRYQITQAEYEGDEPYYDNVSLLLHMDGTNGSTTFTDSSKHRHAVTANGNAQISTAQSKFGGASAAFDGSGDYLSVPSNAAFDFGTGDFTAEAWVFFAGAKPTVAKGIINGQSSGSLNFYFDGGTYAANKLVVSNRLTNQILHSWVPSADTWYHVAVSRSDGQMRLFIDGTNVASVADATDYADAAFNVGGDAGNGASWSINGYIDDLRITKGVARYTANFTPPQRELLPDILAGITPSGLLDQYTGAAAAYSLRSLTSAYTGPVVTVRRSSDSAEADFTATEVSDGTLEAWCGAGDGLVKTLYDQSGHGRHASQSTATAQPKIVSSGVLVLENGRPAIQFATTNTDANIRLQTAAFTAALPQPIAAFCVFRRTSTLDRQTIFDGRANRIYAGSNTATAFYEIDAGAATPTVTATAIDTQQNALSCLFYGAQSSMHINSAQIFAGNVGTNSMDGVTIGHLRGVPSPLVASYCFIGTIQELIIYPVDQSANRVAIEDNINSHYNVF